MLRELLIEMGAEMEMDMGSDEECCDGDTQDAVELFQENPQVTSEIVQRFAAERQIDVETLQQQIYSLLSSYVNDENSMDDTGSMDDMDQSEFGDNSDADADFGSSDDSGGMDVKFRR